MIAIVGQFIEFKCGIMRIVIFKIQILAIKKAKRVKNTIRHKVLHKQMLVTENFEV